MTNAKRLAVARPGYGAEYSALLRIGLPVLVTQLGIIVISFSDTIMVGHHSTAELAAAAFVNNFFMVAMVMLIGFASGLTPLIGALYTQRCYDRAGTTFRIALRLNMLMGALFMVIMGSLYFALDYLGQPPELMPLIRRYYLIVLLTMLPSAIFNCCQQMANGTTDTSTPMWIMLGAIIFNIIGNYALIFGKFGLPEMGLAGAGISTFTARCAAAAVMYAVLCRSRRYRPYGKVPGSEPERGVGRRVFATSWPIMLQSGIECLMWSFGAVVCGWFGAAQLAGYQVMVTISQLGFMTYISVGVAVSILVANYIGVSDFARIRRVTNAGLHFNLVLGTLASAIFLIGGRNLLLCFNDDPAVIGVAMSLLIPLVVYQYCDCVQITYANALRGTSDVVPLFWIAMLSYVVIGTPAQLFLAKGLGLGATGVYWSFVVALAAACLFLALAFRRSLRRAEARVRNCS